MNDSLNLFQQNQIFDQTLIVKKECNIRFDHGYIPYHMDAT